MTRQRTVLVVLVATLAGSLVGYYVYSRPPASPEGTLRIDPTDQPIPRDPAQEGPVADLSPAIRDRVVDVAANISWLDDADRTELSQTAGETFAGYFEADLASYQSVLDDRGLRMDDHWYTGDRPDEFWDKVCVAVHGAAADVDSVKVVPLLRAGNPAGLDELATGFERGKSLKGRYVGKTRGEGDVPYIRDAWDAVDVMLNTPLRLSPSGQMVEGTFSITFARQKGDANWIPMRIRILSPGTQGPNDILISPPLR